MGENPFQDNVDDIDIPDFNETLSITINNDSLNSNPNQESVEIQPNSNNSSDRRAKLEALRKREVELLEKKKLIELQTNDLIPPPNFPSFFPLIRYNPVDDLPQSSHECIKSSLFSLCFITASAIFNVIAVLSVKGPKNYEKVRCFIFACIQGFAAAYLSSKFGYNLLYSSCKKRDIPLKWTIFQFLIISWCIYLTLGFPTSGSVGIATLLDIIANSGPFFSIITGLINTGLSAAAAFYSATTLSKAQAYQKVSGREDNLILNQQPEP